MTEGLDLICAGPETPNPAELLMSPRLGEVIAEARESYDIVIIDSPPILMVTDSAIVGTQVDGIMLVVRVGQTKRQNAQRSVEVLKGLGTPDPRHRHERDRYRVGTAMVTAMAATAVYGYGRPHQHDPRPRHP